MKNHNIQEKIIDEVEQAADHVSTISFHEQEKNEAYLDIGADEAGIGNSELESVITHTIRDWEQYTDTDPGLSGNDIDAFWQGADFDGSETSGGHAPTPGQDVVDENARPWGIHYSADEELNILEKIKQLEKERINTEGWDDSD